MEQDITFYDRLAIKIDLEFMKDQPDETPIKSI